MLEHLPSICKVPVFPVSMQGLREIRDGEGRKRLYSKCDHIADNRDEIFFSFFSLFFMFYVFFS